MNDDKHVVFHATMYKMCLLLQVAACASEMCLPGWSCSCSSPHSSTASTCRCPRDIPCPVSSMCLESPSLPRASRWASSRGFSRTVSWTSSLNTTPVAPSAPTRHIPTHPRTFWGYLQLWFFYCVVLARETLLSFKFYSFLLENYYSKLY